MTTLLLAVFVASLLGSLHCAGMCGGLVAIAVTPVLRGGPVMLAIQARLHVAYHAGRFVAYTALGAVAGALGAALQASGTLVGLQHTAGPIAGALIIAMAVIGLARAIGLRLPSLPTSNRLNRLLSRLHASTSQWTPLSRSTAIGALSGLLPCGWLYMFVVAAAGTGHTATGAAVMAAFWAGSVPILVFVGTGVQALRSVIGRHVPVLMSLALLLVGLWTAGGRLRLPTLHVAPPSLNASTPTAEPPCCSHHGH